MEKGVTELTGMKNKKRVNPFVQIDKNMLSDDDISWKSKGILSYLLSKPDGWITYVSDIEKQSTDGRDSVSSGIKELEKAGYIERKRIREKGRFKGWEYHVYEYPQPKDTENGFPDIGESENGKSENGETENGKSNTSNNDLSNNDLSNNDFNNYNYNNVGVEEAPRESQKKITENAFSFFEQNGFGSLGKHIGDVIIAWIDDIGEELVIKAMEIAVENGKISWKYVDTILLDWSNKKFKCVADYEAHELKRSHDKSQRQKAVGGKGNYRSAREEKTPEWFGEDKPKKELAPIPEKSKEAIDAERAALIKELQGDS